MISKAGNARHGGLPEVRVLDVQGVGGHGGGPLYLGLYGQVVALLGVGHNQHPAGEQLPLLGEDGLGQEAVVPVGEGLGGGRAQPHRGVRPDEGHVEPEGQAVHRPRLQHVELKRDLDPVQVRLVCRLEVDDVPLSLGRADVDVEGVDLDKDADVSDAQNTVLDLTMGCLKYSVMAEFLKEDRLTPWKYSWYQKLTLLNCSMYKASSVNGATWRSPLEGNILPTMKNIPNSLSITPQKLTTRFQEFFGV